METDTEKLILDFLKKQPMGATVTDIANRLNMSRTTTVKYLEVMRATGLLDYKEVGMAKLWFVSTRLSYAEHVLLERTRQVIKAIETPEKHLELIRRATEPHLKTFRTYPAEERKKLAHLFREMADELEVE
ncbi:MAG: helix-turn-helix domain-containing protein [Theionarchaea archaeon]|nr:helix-turn-helix domain-containing protein [Theionarchaea archaeon]MBU6999214.1 helix-turn-helix domain-containing protein [Theionarchaea archaeon]MBU7019661.1 helix-turn-helix domain-containing protein [Theionarchaea archaeon]MBU7034582.1 helix-turn-helix domain-containing protein [Theionarchaea archaeon]